jgi:hypothetical protein
MQLIRCTQKLLKELRVKPTETEADLGSIGGWHANLLRFERRKCVLFTNDETLYSIFVPALKRPDFEYLDEVFRQSLFRRLRIEGFTQSQIEKVLVEYSQVGFAKTNNRSVLGSMNDLSFQIDFHIGRYGGLANLDLDALNDEINRVPMSAINGVYSIDVLKKKIE